MIDSSEAARLLGSIKSPKKAEAVRKNGRLGGVKVFHGVWDGNTWRFDDDCPYCGKAVRYYGEVVAKGCRYYYTCPECGRTGVAVSK